MTLGSLFDGIGGWLLAAKHAGAEPIWASEIDDFPATVTAHHFPEVVQLGDITKINVDKLEPVDIICAGSPCQDLSVAGKREGLSGERSGLFRTAIKLVHGLRARTGKPRYFVWENVPGAFSSNKGLDFAAVLSEITKTEIPMPKNNKWADSGMVEWDGGSLAWRTLDAQYWGVPQRRKRIFLVADFGGLTAGEILFERKGVPRDTAESEGTGQETATNVGASIDSASRIHTIAGNIIGRANQNGGHQLGIGHDVSPTLNTVDRHAVAYSMGHDERSAQFTPNTTDPLTASDYKQPTIVGEPKIAGTLSATFYKGAGNNSVDACLWPDSKANTVRRLVPLECERLMGLPDSWTDVEFNGKPAPDSKRYKAIGNGMAQPVADFVIRRIVEVVTDGA